MPKELTEEHVIVFLRQDRRNRRGVRSHLAPASGSTTRLSGIRLSTPAQLLTEMATLLNLVDLVVLGDDMVRRKLVTPEDLVRAGPSTSTATSRTMRNGQSARRSPSRSRPPSSRLQPRFRVGVNTGPDTVSVLGTGGGHTHTVIGDTVNTASRIEGKAPPGGVAIGPGTKDELPGARTAPLGRLELLGKAEPVEAHLLLGLG